MIHIILHQILQILQETFAKKTAIFFCLTAFLINVSVMMYRGMNIHQFKAIIENTWHLTNPKIINVCYPSRELSENKIFIFVPLVCLICLPILLISCFYACANKALKQSTRQLKQMTQLGTSRGTIIIWLNAFFLL